VGNRGDGVVVHTRDIEEALSDVLDLPEGRGIENVPFFNRDGDENNVGTAKGLSEVLVHLDVRVIAGQEVVRIRCNSDSSYLIGEEQGDQQEDKSDRFPVLDNKDRNLI
jgi:hypothetical protein